MDTNTRGEGWVAFAGIMILLAGVLNVIYGIAAIDGSAFFTDEGRYVIFTDLNTWGWFILIVGALVSIGFVLLFIDRRGEAFLAQAALIGTVTVIVVAGLLLVWFLDHPYEDQAGSIKPEDMQRAIDVMQTEAPGLILPCTPGGEPQQE